MQPFTVSAAIQAMGDMFIDLVGESDKTFRQAAPLSRASGDDITFSRTAEGVGPATAGVIIGPAQTAAPPMGAALIRTHNPRIAFMRVVAALFGEKRVPGVHPTAIIAPSSHIDPSAWIGPYVVIDGDCSVGPDSVIHSHVHLYPQVRIGRDVVVHSGTVIGADGFGYERNAEGVFEKFPHVGGVLIEDEVEIGSNTSIDRGTLGDTHVRRGAKIDNQCHIAHNVIIGEHTAVIAQSMIGGSVTIGAGGWVAPSGCIINNVTLGPGATVGLGAVVTKDIPEGVTVAGVPALPLESFRKLQAFLKAATASGS